MRRVVLRSIGLPLALCLLLMMSSLSRGASTIEQVSPACPPTAMDRALARQAQRTEWLSPRRVRYTLAVYHTDGYADATSPSWTDPATGRVYTYVAAAQINHEYSGGDCTGPDRYSFGGTVTCIRAFGTARVVNECNYLTYGSLQTSPDTGIFANPWGYKQFHIQHSRVRCTVLGGGHLIADSTVWVRTRVITQVRFWLYPSFGYSHLSQMRSITSYEYFSGNSHLHGAGDETGRLSAASPPGTSSDGGLC